MPIYDYLCPTCPEGENKFESLSRPHEPVKCPACGAFPCERLLTAHAGYSINGNNSASQRPSQAGSFKRKK